ncbi:hypothetical protein CYLTODRAFT_435250 [Cylindrobasidium torrendii FP15055 ss-10]|uniref:PUB domain-containing protein n=1 Tax=Cylindrobasidium torrendii FP15055 ss-10 TaxID=1314674 RepID=A0A0D7BPF2_9AGAR|nr:hypothetical protein CYLTODRAFT_435250 [Cylindrobasidium torrendii FP15055 ss-10]
MADIQMDAPEDSPARAVSPQALADAIERRTRALPAGPTAAQMALEQERKLLFRRMIEPGITRPNNKEQAMASLKTLLTIAENILNHPGETKYQQFKPTNTIIKKNLVEPKGALEYAIEMGFRPEVELSFSTPETSHLPIQVVNFQPYYTWNPKKLQELKIGCAMIKETVTLETEKEERAKSSREAEKAAKLAAAERVRLAFMDDRRSKLQNDERERQYREGLAARKAAAKDQAAKQAAEQEEEDSDADVGPRMPGAGYSLSGPAPSASSAHHDEDE